MLGTSASKKSAFSGTAAVAIVTAGVLLAGCASKGTASGGKPPKLLIGTGTSAGNDAAPMIAAAGTPARGAAIAPQPVGGFAGFGGYVIAGTLPTTPTRAPIYTWQAGKASEADVTKLATALGLTGTPKRHSYGWELTTSAGDLRVRDGDGEQWSYNRADTITCPAYQTDVDNADGASVGFACAVAAPPPVAEPGTTASGTTTSGTTASGDASSGPATSGTTTTSTASGPTTSDTTTSGGAPTPAPITLVQGPDETATKAAAASLLSALGVAGSENFYASSPSSTLAIAPQIDGMPTQGIETNVDVDAKGIRAATGRLVTPKSGTDYPLQTAAAAFKSLSDRPVPAIAMYCGPVPVDGGPVPPVPAASGPNTKFPLNPVASATPVPASSGPNVFFPLNPSASASPGTGWVGSPPAAPVSAAPAPVSGPAVGSAGPASPPNVVTSAYPCPTPTPQKVTGAVIGLQVQYNASGATTAADGSTSGGSNILVPTWFFTVEGQTDPLTVIAVDPSFLGDQTPIPPVGAASAGETSGGFEGSGGGASANAGTVAVPPSAVPALPPTAAAKS